MPTVAPVFSSTQAHIGRELSTPLCRTVSTWQDRVMSEPVGVMSRAGTARVAPSESAAPRSIFLRAPAVSLNWPYIPETTRAPDSFGDSEAY